MAALFADVILPALATVVVWWAGTALILRLDRLPARTFKWSFAAFSVMLVLAYWGLRATRDDTTVAAAWAAFGCGVMVWAWHEVGFLLGFVTGPRVAALPAQSGPWRHLSSALEVILYHECALILSAVVVWAITAGAPNQTGLWTFVILWAMRQSAKLNLFLGVRNLGREFLPPHLHYLGTYFVKRRMNLLFPVSMAASTVIACLIWRAVPAQSGFDAVSLVFAGSLLTLGIIEHLFMVMPIGAQALWQVPRSGEVEATAPQGQT